MTLKVVAGRSVTGLLSCSVFPLKSAISVLSQFTKNAELLQAGKLGGEREGWRRSEGGGGEGAGKGGIKGRQC